MAIDRTLQPAYPISTDPGTVIVETERLIIRRYLYTDAAALVPAANFAEIAANLRDGFPHPFSLEAAEGYIKKCCAPAENSYLKSCAVLLKPNGVDNPTAEARQIGDVGIKPGADVNYRTWEMGYWFTPSAWGKGYATEMVRGYTRWLFATWPKLNRVEADVYDFNAASAAVLVKAGFVKEGVKRGSCEKGGSVRDEIIFGLTRSDVERLEASGGE